MYYNPTFFEKYLNKSHQNDLVSGLDKLSSSVKLDEIYQMEVSAVFSSQIEGNSVDLNSFMNGKANQKQPKSKDFKQILDLISGYETAKQSVLNEENLLKIHKIISKNILIKEKIGIYRNEPIGVFGASGLIYMAVEPEKVPSEVKNLFLEIENLLSKNLSLAESFFFASSIHLKFVQIHPFADRNGRMARLLEKWFLAEKIGKIGWLVPSEKYYFENRKMYYSNLNLGVDYYNLKNEDSLPFLKMLPESLEN